MLYLSSIERPLAVYLTVQPHNIQAIDLNRKGGGHLRNLNATHMLHEHKYKTKTPIKL